MMVDTVVIGVILFVLSGRCSGDNYYLNESDYDKMPALFAMDSNYRSCLMEPGGVYCVATFELQRDPQNELIRMIKEYSQQDIKYYNHSIIDRAICVTRSCKKFIQNETLDTITNLNGVLEGCANETIWAEYGLEAKLAHVIACDKHGDEVPADLGDWALAGILIALLIINIIGTAYDVWFIRNRNEKNRTGNPYLLSFSILRSWQKLTDTTVDQTYEKLYGIHGLRSIATFFVAASHVMWLIGTGFTDNPRDFEKAHERLYYQVIFNGMVIVQIFFVISGCLLTFHLQVVSEDEGLSWKDVPKILFYRWIRLTPAYALMLLFTATWLRHLGSGPLWKMLVLGVAADCRLHWWKHLLYFNNYVVEDRYCAVHSWHVATEMQLFTLGLLVFVATAPRTRYLAFGLLALLGTAAPALHVWFQDLDALVIHKPEFYRSFENETFRYLHILGHNNLSSHAIGMVVGLLSYYCVKHRIEYTESKMLKILTWCLPLGAVVLFLSGKMFYVDGARPHVALRMAYAAVHRPALGLMTALLLLNFVMKFENVIRSALEWRGWVVTSRLCYGVYLLHVNFIHVLLGARTQLGHVSFFHVITNHFGVVFMSLATSVPYYLLLELPLTTLMKILIGISSDTKLKKE